VLELVEGPTLADRIERGPIPLDEALSIARQIAEALGAAHEQGIVHRDLKPANIKLRPDGTIKVLDFGLAKALDAGTAAIDPSQSGTIMNPAMTGVGVILGTAAYMSPEQAKGRAADKRSDIWGFGCVLYEMLSGRRAFEAEDVADTLAAVLRGEPDWRALPDETPVSIRTLIRACLEKDRRQRLPDVSAALFVVTHQDSLAATVAAPTPASRIPMWRRSIPAVLAVAGAAAVSGYVVWTMNPLPPQAVTRSTIALSTGDYFSSTGRKLVALSLDGTHLVYSANQQLYVRALDQLESEPLRGTEGLGLNPFLSPDGRWIGFWQDRQLNSQAVIFSSGRNAEVAPGSRRLFRQAADGSGAVEQLTQPETAQWPYPYSVTPDGTGLVFADQLPPVGQPGETGDLMLLPLAGDRRPEPLLQTSFAEVNGEVSPDGRWLAYQSNESGREEVYVRPFPKAGTGKWQISTSGGTRPAWGRNGRELFYVSMGALMSVPVTAASTFVAGSATRLFDGPYLFDVAARPGRTYDVSPDGQRFLMIKEADTTDEPAPFARIILVQNWFEELKRRVPRN
jgi:hypothetical protein